jgi:geranylgeranyl reductase family protein
MGNRKITIVGAGPAGLTAAIFLGKLGYPVTVIEKDIFPRDKICGDCLGGFAISIISQISDRFFEDFIKYDKKITGKGVHFFGPQHQKISVPAVTLIKNRIHEVALSKRMDFDAFLFEETRRYGSIQFKNDIKIGQIIRNASHLTLVDDQQKFSHETDLLILASGSIRTLSRQLTGEKMDKHQYATGIRAYFENVATDGDEDYIELHFLKDLAPGYLWIFPLPGNIFNVGLGLRTDSISKRGLDLKKTFHNILHEDAYFKKRFINARQVDEVKGFPLALGGKKRHLSGDRFLLAGDAGHLIEPLFGEGIGHAMYSGKFAAEHAIECLKKDDFSAAFNRAYDKMVYDKIGITLKFSKWMNQVAQHPALMQFLFNRVNRNESLKHHLFRIINGQMPKTGMKGLELIGRLITGI